MNGVEQIVLTHLIAATVGAYGMYRYLLFLNDHFQHKGVEPMRVHKDKPPGERFWDRPNPKLKVAAIVIAVLAMIGTGLSDIYFHNARDDDRQSTAQRLSAFQRCINAYSRTQHTYQVANREATIALQLAQQRHQMAIEELQTKNTALWALVTRQITTGEATPKSVAINTLGEYHAAAGRERVAALAETRAKAHLDQVRAANPVPEPPAVACPSQRKETP